MAEQILFDDAPGLRNARPGLGAPIAAWLAGESERWILWVPVALGAGIVGYFLLPSEPPLGIGPGLVLLLALAGWGVRHRPVAGLALVTTGLVAAGFAAGQIRTAWIDAPVLERRVGPLAVEGRVVAVEGLGNGVRLILDSVGMEAREKPPLRIRLRAAGAEAPPVGARVRVRAVLQPPPRPVAPGAYDFGRQLYFDRIGAVGYTAGKIEILTEGEDGQADMALRLEALRQWIAERVTRRMEGAEGAIAIALLTGEKGGIPASAQRAMQESGLAHLLAISGLHIGLVAGIVFFLVRAVLALLEPVALRWPIKKWAALAALVAAAGYTQLVGAPVPTQRALIMTGLVLLAVVFDRNPVSLRLVALAATAVLLASPEAVLGPSFQMSFAAVVALIAGYERLGPRLGDWRAQAGLLGRGGIYLAGMVATSVLAGLATLPFALYHFNQVQFYGVLANMLAVPLTSVWIMPAGLLACLTLPFGLEAWPMAAMESGIGLLLAVAHWVAGLPGAAMRVGAMPDWGLAAMTLGGLWLTLWSRRPRWLGLVGILAGALSLMAAPKPDLLVSGRGTLVAVRAPDGSLMLSSRSADRFTADNWLRRNGQESAEAWPAHGEAMGGRVRCDGLGCVWQAADGRRVAIVKEREALAEDCRLADIVVSLVPAGHCRAAAVIDFFDLWREGTHALYLAPGELRVETVEGVRGMRPWTGRHPSQ